MPTIDTLKDASNIVIDHGDLIITNDIGVNVTVHVRQGSIICHGKIGNNSRITATHIQAGDIGEAVILKATTSSISAGNVGKRCKLEAGTLRNPHEF